MNAIHPTLLVSPVHSHSHSPVLSVYLPCQSRLLFHASAHQGSLASQFAFRHLTLSLGPDALLHDSDNVMSISRARSIAATKLSVDEQLVSPVRHLTLVLLLGRLWLQLEMAVSQELELKMKLHEESTNPSVVIPDFPSQAIELHHPSGPRKGLDQEHRHSVRTRLGWMSGSHHPILSHEFM
jgi:hypothetical protein